MSSYRNRRVVRDTEMPRPRTGYAKRETESR